MKAEDRFWVKVDKTSTCWLWLGGKVCGYGRFSFNGKPGYAHRYSLSLVEPLVAGLEIDHLCRNRACVNPKHLEQVTHRTNVLRSPIAQAALNAKKTHCPKGHRLPSTVTGKPRLCRACGRKVDRGATMSDKRRKYMRSYMARWIKENPEKKRAADLSYQAKQRKVKT